MSSVERLSSCHSDLFGLRLIENPSLKRDAGQASMTKRSRKDSRQAGMTTLKSYVNLLNAFVLVIRITNNVHIKNHLNHCILEPYFYA